YPQLIVVPFFARTCNDSKVARLPIGVNFGPRSLPITFAYTMASFTAPVAVEASIDNAVVRTVGILFITEDNKADSTPVPIAAPHIPPSANLFNNNAM